MKTKTLLTALTLLLSLQLTTAQNIINGGSVEGLWTLNNSPYLIRGPIFVDDHKTLQIEAGVEVIFETTDRMIINGNIIAIGNSSDTILFSTDNPERGWGGIRFENVLPGNDNSNLSYCKFEYANAMGNWPYHSGGAIGVLYTNNLSIEHCLFENNKALGQSGIGPDYLASGGAIAIWLSEIRLSKNVFRNNESVNGGAIFINNYSKAIIDNSLFYGNTALDSGGAISVSDHATPYFINCTFADNYANHKGGAIATLEGADPSFLNSLIWGNSANEDGDQIYVEDQSGINLNFCNIEGGLEEIAGNFIYTNQHTNYNYNPKYNTKGIFPYSISGSSRCVDLGTQDWLYMPQNYEQPVTDLLDNKRINGTTIDIGCFENNQHKTNPKSDTDKFASPSDNINDWTIVETTVTNNDLFAIQFTDDNHGWAVGSYGTVIYTTDAGQRWTEQSFGSQIDFYDLQFLDDYTGFIVGVKYVGPHLYGIVYKTVDGGQNWDLSYLSESPMVLNSISFVNDQNGFITGHSYGTNGTNGLMIKTVDAGINWKSTQVNANIIDIDNIMFNQGNWRGMITGWATGKMNVGPSEVSVILKSVDMGDTWNSVFINNNEKNISDVSFHDYEYGISTTDNGDILMTNNGGINWTTHSMDQYNFNAALYVDFNYAIVIGNDGSILSTYNNGKHWVIEHTRIESNLNAICSTSEDFMWIAGNEGTLFYLQKPTKNDEIEMEWINKEGAVSGFNNNSDIESNDGPFVNHKNYPNPFSSKTTISFQLNQQSHVKLEIYNINGQLITILKDQVLETGNHEVIFDANDLPHGIYTYILSDGRNIENGKMIK